LHLFGVCVPPWGVSPPNQTACDVANILPTRAASLAASLRSPCDLRRASCRTSPLSGAGTKKRVPATSRRVALMAESTKTASVTLFPPLTVTASVSRSRCVDAPAITSSPRAVSGTSTIAVNPSVSSYLPTARMMCPRCALVP
jgi:hypothetical protein